MKINVLKSRLPAVMEAFELLRKKAARYGCEGYELVSVKEWTYEAVQEDWQGFLVASPVQYVELEIVGEPPRVGDFTFVAKIEFVEGGNLIRTKFGHGDLHARFQTTGNVCEHCNTTRRRNDLFVVEDVATGEQMQVGRSCLQAFVGHDISQAIGKFKFAHEVQDLEGQFSRYGANEWNAKVQSVVEIALASVRVSGWCSVSTARETGSVATSAEVSLVLSGGCTKDEKARIQQIRDAAKPEDVARAAQIIEWAANLTGASDYEHNMRVLFSVDTINNSRSVSFVVSAVGGYERHMAKLAAAAKVPGNTSEHVGQVGQRMKGIPVTVLVNKVVGSSMWGDTVLVKLEDEQGNQMAWFTTKVVDMHVGDKCKLDATVKGHSVFNTVKQTDLQRCKLVSL